MVTLSTMFIVQGVTLAGHGEAGRLRSRQLGSFYLGDAIPSLLPMPILLLARRLAVWLWLKYTRFGTAIYAVGSDAEAARSAGVRVMLMRFLVYVIAGGCYGLAGVFISAQTGSGDPLVGNPLLLSIFAAVVVGGTRLGGGRGGPIGSVFGAYILMIVVNILLVLNVSAYYSTIAEGVILILAVLAASLSGDSELARQLRLGGRPLFRLARRRPSAPDRWRRSAAAKNSYAGAARSSGGMMQRHSGCDAQTPALCAALLRMLSCGRRRCHRALAWQRRAALGLLEFADRAVELPGHSGARPRHRHPDRRASTSACPG